MFKKNPVSAFSPLGNPYKKIIFTSVKLKIRKLKMLPKSEVEEPHRTPYNAEYHQRNEKTGWTGLVSGWRCVCDEPK